STRKLVRRFRYPMSRCACRRKGPMPWIRDTRKITGAIEAPRSSYCASTTEYLADPLAVVNRQRQLARYPAGIWPKTLGVGTLSVCSVSLAPFFPKPKPPVSPNAASALAHQTPGRHLPLHSSIPIHSFSARKHFPFSIAFLWRVLSFSTIVDL